MVKPLDFMVKLMDFDGQAAGLRSSSRWTSMVKLMDFDGQAAGLHGQAANFR
jgi:hypothetical protein